MAEAKDLEVKVNVNIDTQYPKVPSTMEERIKAAQVAKPLLAGVTPISSTAVGVSELIRLAEYLATGHDYYDTHPSKPEGPSKKERRKARKDIRKIVAEEVAEEIDSRQRVGAGTLIMPRVLIQEEDGSTTDTSPEDETSKYDPWTEEGKDNDS